MQEDNKPKLIPQWMPTKEQRAHLDYWSSEDGMTLTGYIKQLVRADMGRRGKPQ